MKGAGWCRDARSRPPRENSKLRGSGFYAALAHELFQHSPELPVGKAKPRIKFTENLRVGFCRNRSRQAARRSIVCSMTQRSRLADQILAKRAEGRLVSRVRVGCRPAGAPCSATVPRKARDRPAPLAKGRMGLRPETFKSVRTSVRRRPVRQKSGAARFFAEVCSQAVEDLDPMDCGRRVPLAVRHASSAAAHRVVESTITLAQARKRRCSTKMSRKGLSPRAAAQADSRGCAASSAIRAAGASMARSPAKNMLNRSPPHLGGPAVPLRGCAATANAAML